MIYRQLGASGLRVPGLTRGTMTLGGVGVSNYDEELSRLEEVSRPPLIYPYWHQAASASDRLSPGDLTLLGRHIASEESVSP